MKWSDEVFFNPVFSIELIRYFILIIAIIVIGNISASIQPWATKTLNSFLLQCIILFLTLLITIYNLEQKVTYKSFLIAVIVSIITALLLYFFVIKNTTQTYVHMNQQILLDRIFNLEYQLQKKSNNNDLETSTPIK